MTVENLREILDDSVKLILPIDLYVAKYSNFENLNNELPYLIKLFPFHLISKRLIVEQRTALFDPLQVMQFEVIIDKQTTKVTKNSLSKIKFKPTDEQKIIQDKFSAKFSQKYNKIDAEINILNEEIDEMVRLLTEYFKDLGSIVIEMEEPPPSKCLYPLRRLFDFFKDAFVFIRFRKAGSIGIGISRNQAIISST